jgi:hypothetical protein
MTAFFLFYCPITVMAALVAAIYFPESYCFLHRFWKMDGPGRAGP